MRRPFDIMFDSTGIKVYGEGESKVRQHGITKRLIWKKLHVGIDSKSSKILIGELTDNGVDSIDGGVARRLIKAVPRG